MRHLQNIFIVIILILLGCGTVERKDNIKVKSENNFYISISDSDIVNTSDNKICYYTIYIDKNESGRTTTGPESQEKVFEAVLTPAKHLIKVEKWVLNESLGRYIKVNNIDQPKPDYIYVDIKKDNTIKMKIKSSKTGAAEYKMEAE